MRRSTLLAQTLAAIAAGATPIALDAKEMRALANADTYRFWIGYAGQAAPPSGDFDYAKCLHRLAATSEPPNWSCAAAAFVNDRYAAALAPAFVNLLEAVEVLPTVPGDDNGDRYNVWVGYPGKKIAEVFQATMRGPVGVLPTLSGESSAPDWYCATTVIINMTNLDGLKPELQAFVDAVAALTP
jgi:hypothetical protein